MAVVMTVFAVTTAMAQHAPVPVEPGCRGGLPDLPLVEEAALGRFGDLLLDRVTEYIIFFNGTKWTTKEVWLSFFHGYRLSYRAARRSHGRFCLK